MARLRVTAKRPPPLEDLSIIEILDYNTAFPIDIMQQLDDGEVTLKERVDFIPESVTPVPPLPPVVEGILWDSNTHGLWNNGEKRIVLKSEGNIKPDGKGLWMAASGKPRLEIIGDGSSNLICDAGHGRFYVAARNFNSKLTLDFALSKETDNLSLKLRSRHQQGGNGENRFGGYGCSISLTDVGMKREDYHNVHSNSKSKDFSQRLKTDTWYTAEFTVQNDKDNKKVLYLCRIDFKDGKGLVEVLSHSDPSPKAYMMDEKSFLEDASYFWIRQNCEAKATIRLRNVQLVKV